MKAFLIPVLIALSTAAMGEESIVTIPGQEWDSVVHAVRTGEPDACLSAAQKMRVSDDIFRS